MKLFNRTSRGQLSIELFVIVAVVVGLALLLTTQMQGVANTANEKITNKTNQIWDRIANLSSADAPPAYFGQNSYENYQHAAA